MGSFCIYALFLYGILGIKGAFSYDAFGYSSFQLHGDSDNMVLDLLTPVNKSLIRREVSGCGPRVPTYFTPIEPNKLRSVYWADNLIFAVNEYDNETVEKVTLYRNCYNALVVIQVGNSVVHYVGKDGEFEFVSDSKFEEELKLMGEQSTVNINNRSGTEYLMYDEYDLFGIEWYNFVPNGCYCIDKVVADEIPIWSAKGCEQRFSMASVYVDGDDKLVELGYRDNGEMKELFFWGDKEKYDEITFEEFEQRYHALQEKIDSAKIAYEEELARKAAEEEAAKKAEEEEAARIAYEEQLAYEEEQAKKAAEEE